MNEKDKSWTTSARLQDKAEQAEATTVWLESHRLEDGLGEERVTADQSDDPDDQDETAEAESDPAAVSRAPLVTTAWGTISNYLHIIVTIELALGHCGLWVN